MANKYWVGGSGNWDGTTTNWSNTSGGAGGANPPQNLDTAIFNSASSATSYTVAYSNVSNMDFISIAGPASGSVSFTTTGDRLQLNGTNAGLTIPATGVSNCLLAITFANTGTSTVTTNGVSVYSLNFDNCNASLGSAVTCTNTFQFYGGSSAPTLTTNNWNITAANFLSSFTTSPYTRTLTLGSSAISVTSQFNASVPGTLLTVTSNTATITLTSASAKTFNGGGKSWGSLVNSGAGILTINGSNTFGTISNATQPTTFNFTSGTTQTVTNFNVSGTSGNLVTIKSSTAASAATLSMSSGIVSSDYLSLKDSTATGGAAWYAGLNSTNVSGNTGWLFRDGPSGNFFLVV